MRKARPYVRLLIALSALFGIFLNLIDADNVLEMLSYYTIQSNLLVAVLFLILAWFDWKNQPWDDAWSRILTFVFTVGITVTMLVFHLLLAPTIEPGGEYVVNGLPDLFVHTITPILTIVHWFLYSKKGAMKATDPLFTVLQPLDYLLYIVFYNLLGGRFTWNDVQSPYPYFFLNLEVYGWTGVLMWSVILLLMYLVLGFLFYFIDSLRLSFEARRPDGRS
jgi:hypothetical protein